MTGSAYELDDARRGVVLDTICEVCRHRGWRLLAAHVRTTHVRAVVHANVTPEKIMNDFKAYASRRLTEAGFESKHTKRWSRHGSTKYLWREAYLRNALHYTLHRQGAPMQRYAEDATWLDAPENEPRPTEPRA
jgi:REP element-mobilizing transposase RayT